MLTEVQTTAPGTVADIAAQRAVAAAEAGTPRSSRSSALDRAIEAAEAFVPEFLRICDQDNEAEAAAYKVHSAMAEQIEAAETLAEATQPRPDLLRFKRDPDNKMVGMVVRYESGREMSSDYKDADYFEPESRESLIRHCLETGREPRSYVRAWDAWQSRRRRAIADATPIEVREADAAEGEASKAMNRAHNHLHTLLNRLIKARVDTPADLVRKVQAYAGICRATKYDLFTMVEGEAIVTTMLSDLGRMTSAPVSKPHLQLVG